MRATGRGFGEPIVMEVRDLPREAASAALAAALAEAAEVERMTDPADAASELARLNEAAGKGPRQVDMRLLVAVGRALNFCIWSEGKEGPLASDLYRLWGRVPEAPRAEPPPPGPLGQAVVAAACQHLTVDADRQMVTLEAGSALDLTDWRQGMAVDRAIETLRQRGAANAWVEIGPLRRGIGGGPAGRGWPVELPAIGGLTEPLGRIYLRDQALAVAALDEHPLRIGVERLSPFLNQRTGQPADGVVATLAVTTLAIDAQPLAATMAITGARDGELLMGSIRPRPAILWLMGSGTGIPLLVDYRWSDLPHR
jgi:thiamine biosynthesis lipoprotein